MRFSTNFNSWSVVLLAATMVTGATASPGQWDIPSGVEFYGVGYCQASETSADTLTECATKAKAAGATTFYYIGRNSGYATYCGFNAAPDVNCDKPTIGLSKDPKYVQWSFKKSSEACHSANCQSRGGRDNASPGQWDVPSGVEFYAIGYCQAAETRAATLTECAAKAEAVGATTFYYIAGYGGVSWYHGNTYCGFNAAPDVNCNKPTIGLSPDPTYHQWVITPKIKELSCYAHPAAAGHASIENGGAFVPQIQMLGTKDECTAVTAKLDTLGNHVNDGMFTCDVGAGTGRFLIITARDKCEAAVNYLDEFIKPVTIPAHEEKPPNGGVPKFTTENEWCEGQGMTYKCCEYYWRPRTNKQCNAAVDKLNCWTGATTGAYCDTVTAVATTNPSPGPTTNPSPGPTTNPSPGPTTNPSPGPTTNPSPGPTGNPTPGPTSQLDRLEGAISTLSVMVRGELSEIKGLLNHRDQAPSCYGRRTQA